MTRITGTRFTQNLYYNTGVGTAKYNGSISSMTWKADNERTVRGYKFTYDALDRLLNGTYGEGDQLNSNSGRYSEKVTGYDKNGNITGLERYGRSGYSSYDMCDALTYTLNGNQVTRVDDLVSTGAGNDETDFKDIVKQANEYTYDANGNLTKDLNKGITGITYNCLNLPNVVTFSDGSTVTYTYSADGTKLRTVHKIGSTTTTTDYCGNVIYENNIAKLLLTGEGYISLNDKKYHYYLQDHQGNNRVVVDKDGNVEEVSHYYPFGGVFALSQNVQPYKYNGKELDTEKGLNWYDYGARQYDAVLGRFTTMDRFAEKYYSASPYAYCLNNPILNIDPNGEDVYGFDTNTGKLSIVEHNKDEFDRIKLGTFNKENKFTVTNEDKYLDISKGTLLGEHFDDISKSGIVFHEGFASEGIETMKFLSFHSNIEFSAWAYKSDMGIGLSISPWALNGIKERGSKTYMQSRDFYINQEKVGYLGEKFFNIHTHPASKNGLGGYGKPSDTDFKNIQINRQHPHYILSKREGIIQYYPDKTWKKSYIH